MRTGPNRQHGSAAFDRSGHSALWGWFGLSYASFLTLPRVLMHEMPDEWQAKMAALLREYDETFPGVYQLDLSPSVAFKRNNRFTHVPRWLTNYRHPNRVVVDSLRGRR